MTITPAALVEIESTEVVMRIGMNEVETEISTTIMKEIGKGKGKEKKTITKTKRTPMVEIDAVIVMSTIEILDVGRTDRWHDGAICVIAEKVNMRRTRSLEHLHRW